MACYLTVSLMLFGGIVSLFILARVLESWLRRHLIENITDKYVFITGCDTGFGNALAKQLDMKGVHVIAACLTEKGLTDLDDVTSDRVMTLTLDVTDHESVVTAYEEVKKHIPNQSALWGVVNNAGVANCTGYLEWGRREDYQRVLAVNLLGTIDVTLTFLPLLKKSNGRLVNVASSAGRVAPIPGGYCESKFAVEAFSDTVRRERSQFGYGYHVSIIEPGFFATPLASTDTLARFATFAFNRLSDQKKKEFPKSLLEKFVNKKASVISSLASRNLSQVTDVIEHALFAKWPRTRYAVGMDAMLFWVPMSYLPAWLQDKMLEFI